MMTPHAQNIALAKLDGWKPVPDSRHFRQGCPMPNEREWERNGLRVASFLHIPRYTESLDALRPILLRLSDVTRVVVIDELLKKFAPKEDRGNQTAVGLNSLVRRATMLLTASASQMSEAILRAVGKYT